jgi:hypothetical protein
VVDIAMFIDGFERLPKQLFVDRVSNKIDFGKEPVDQLGSEGILWQTVLELSNLRSARFCKRAYLFRLDTAIQEQTLQLLFRFSVVV